MPKGPLIAVLHDGQYHNDKIVFDPIVDQVPYKAGETLADIVAKYDDPKAASVVGAFVTTPHCIQIICGDKPASEAFQPDRAICQARHRLMSLASMSLTKLGILPGVPDIVYTPTNIDLSGQFDSDIPTATPRKRVAELNEMADAIAADLRRQRLLRTQGAPNE